MRRIKLIVVAVLVGAMVLALALPAFAQEGADVGTATCSQPPGSELASGQGVVTPSENINVQCRALAEPGSNAGGSGGGPAEVLSDEDVVPPPLELETGGEDIFFSPAGNEDAQAQLVETPSGNLLIQGHSNPNGN